MTDNNESVTVVIIFLSFLLGIGAGYLGFKAFADLNNYYHIKYVAESEIMELEKARVAAESKIQTPAEKNLFFGDIDRAVELTAKVAASYNDRKTKVVYSLFPVFADDVESISQEVHEAVVEKMRQDKSGS